MMCAKDGFEARPDRRCQRGLAVTYSVDRAFDEARLARALQEAWDHSLVEGCERFGPRVVRRLVRQFCFEVRIGDRDREISFLHRALASAEQRADQTVIFESCLRAELTTARSAP